MKISYAKLERTARSGQTFYRVWGFATQRHGVVRLDVDVYHFCGKRSRASQSGCFGGRVSFHPKPNKNKDPQLFADDTFRRGRSVDVGVAWFTTRRGAERFIDETLRGQHPEAVYQLINHHEMVDELEEGLNSFMSGWRGDCDEPDYRYERERQHALS